MPGHSDDGFTSPGSWLAGRVQDKTCGTVLLTSTEPDAYRIVKEIIVRRRVVVTGRPSTMPLINAEDANRAFRVIVRGGPCTDGRSARWRGSGVSTLLEDVGG